MKRVKGNLWGFHFDCFLLRKWLVAPSDVTWPYYRPLPRQLHPSRAPPGSPARLGRVQLGAARLSSTRRSLRRIEDGDRRVGSGRRRALHRQPLPRWRRPWNIGASRPLGSSTVSTQSTRFAESRNSVGYHVCVPHLSATTAAAGN